jgi:SAM-dependent methyltransferase
MVRARTKTDSLYWLPAQARALLDVGCNVGAFLGDCRSRFPNLALAGIDINEAALQVARERLPGVILHRAGAEQIPFPDQNFDYVTCTEVLTLIPPALHAPSFREMRRVLRVGGRLFLTVPHTGWFAWMNVNNVRFRARWLYKTLVGSGLCDAEYAAAGRQLGWHEHFSLRQLLHLAGAGWEVVAVRRGGLLLYPLMAWLSWPFYRIGRPEHWLRQAFERVAARDYAADYGDASYGIMLVLRRCD